MSIKQHSSPSLSATETPLAPRSVCICPPITETRSGPVGLLRDLQELYLLAHQVDITWTMIKQAGQGLRDKELLDVVSTCDGESKTQMQWLQTRLKTTASQALLVAD